MNARIGLLGGTFNPIHFGHLIAARDAAEHLNLSKVVLIPSASPPHKNTQDLAPAADRLEMVRLAVTGDPLFEVSDIELARTGPSYTFDTVTEIRARVGADAELFWIIGADTLPELASWSRIQQLVDIVQIVTAARPGGMTPDLSALRRMIGDAKLKVLTSRQLPTREIQISASEIRSRLATGRSVRYLLPDPVINYILDKHIYGTSHR